MQWEIREFKGEKMPWKVCLANTKEDIIYGAAFSKNIAQITARRLNNTENAVDLDEDDGD
jgi:hypothetical protein